MCASKSWMHLLEHTAPHHSGCHWFSLRGPARRKCIFILNRIILFRFGKWAFNEVSLNRDSVYIICIAQALCFYFLLDWICSPNAVRARGQNCIDKTFWKSTSLVECLEDRKSETKKCTLFIQRSRLTALSLHIFFAEEIVSCKFSKRKKKIASCHRIIVCDIEALNIFEFNAIYDSLMIRMKIDK